MNIICEMIISDFFKLSSGQTALVGIVAPEYDYFIPESKADLYIDELKCKTIHIIGEDRFSGSNVVKRQGKRAVRTDDDVTNELSSKGDCKIKLVIYKMER